jgi:small GTP-binding protein
MEDYLDDINEIDAEYKVILVGDSTIGKTSFFKKITSGLFYEKNVSTIGFDRKILEFEITTEEEGKEVKKRISINLTDTAGQERYFSITQSYFKGSNGVFLLYSITDQKSFKNLNKWLNTVRNKIGNYEDNKYLIFLMGTKLDLVENDENLRKVSEKEAMDFCDKNNINWYGEVSSKNISKKELEEMLTKISKQLYEKIGFNKFVRNTLSTLDKKKANRKKCC